MRTVLLLVGVSCLLPAGAWGQKKEADNSADTKKEAAQRKLIGVINGQAGAIDACTSRYLAEYPKADASVSVQLKVDKEGSVARSVVTTSLQGARNLRPCLQKAAKAYRFPPPKSDELVTLTFPVQVRRNAKFKLYMPGEEPKTPEAKQRAPSFFKLLPTDWTDSEE